MKILGILGPTGVGKSATAVEVAKRLNLEILSADSMQVYKDMNIGTAKVTKEEMQGIPHHMIDVVTPDVDFSAQDYCDGAVRSVAHLENVVMAGGTGFYFDCLIYPLDFAGGEQTAEIRRELQTIYRQFGREKLWQMLSEMDYETFETIDRNNIKRVIRALEIAMSGQKKSQGQGKRKCAFDHKLYVLTADRQFLYENSDRRVDKMVRDGLVDEVAGILRKYNCRNSTSMQAIGYKEIVSFLDGKCSLSEAIERLKINTRHYIKRQITYFKRLDAQWIDVQTFGGVEKVAGFIACDYKM